MPDNIYTASWAVEITDGGKKDGRFSGSAEWIYKSWKSMYDFSSRFLYKALSVLLERR